jgi:hypothetical protein
LCVAAYPSTIAQGNARHEEQSMAERYFQVLITRDATESAQVCVKVDDEGLDGDALTRAAFEAARDTVQEVEWTMDEANQHDPYMGDPENNVTELGADDYERLEARRGVDPANLLSVVSAVAFDVMPKPGDIRSALARSGIHVSETDLHGIASEMATAAARFILQRGRRDEAETAAPRP